MGKLRLPDEVLPPENADAHPKSPAKSNALQTVEARQHLKKLEIVQESLKLARTVIDAVPRTMQAVAKMKEWESRAVIAERNLQVAYASLDEARLNHAQRMKRLDAEEQVQRGVIALIEGILKDIDQSGTVEERGKLRDAALPLVEQLVKLRQATG